MQGGCELRAVPLFSRKAAAEGACGWAALQPQLQGQLQEKGWMTALQWQDEYSVLQVSEADRGKAERSKCLLNT
jgi:hypothetical protein